MLKICTLCHICDRLFQLALWAEGFCLVYWLSVAVTWRVLHVEGRLCGWTRAGAVFTWKWYPSRHKPDFGIGSTFLQTRCSLIESCLERISLERSPLEVACAEENRSGLVLTGSCTAVWRFPELQEHRGWFSATRLDGREELNHVLEEPGGTLVCIQNGDFNNSLEINV